MKINLVYIGLFVYLYIIKQNQNGTIPKNRKPYPYSRDDFIYYPVYCHVDFRGFEEF